MLAQRLASAAVGLPLLLLVVWVGPPWFSVLVAAAAALGAAELSSMARQWGDRPATAIAVALAAALVVGAHFLAGSSYGSVVAPIVSLCAIAALVWLLWNRRRGTLLTGLGSTLGAALYSGGTLFHAPLLRALEQGREWALFLLLVTFATDTAAFFVGRTIGKRRLAPTISPSKTWEGAIGGVAGALAAGVGVWRVFSLDANVWEILILAALVGSVGQVGDLAESRLKRIAGIKDSGRLVPGHGGILDRLDSIVFNLVVVYHFVLWGILQRDWLF